MKSTSFVDNLNPPKTMRDILRPMSTSNSVWRQCKRAEYRVCRWRSLGYKLKSTESDRFVTKCEYKLRDTKPQGMLVCPSKIKNLVGEERERNWVALSIQFLSTPPNRQTACKQKFTKYDFVINVYAAFTYITKIKCDSMDQRDIIVSYKSNFISNEKCCMHNTYPKVDLSLFHSRIT